MAGFMNRKKQDQREEPPSSGGGFMRRKGAAHDHEISASASADDPQADAMPTTNRMGSDDEADQGGFMSSRPMPKKRRGFMGDQQEA